MHAVNPLSMRRVRFWCMCCVPLLFVSLFTACTSQVPAPNAATAVGAPGSTASPPATAAAPVAATAAAPVAATAPAAPTMSSAATARAGTLPLPTIDPAVVSTYVPPPPVRSYPATAAEVQSWIDAVDLVQIRAHSWDIWESITTPVDDIGTPLWETWFSGHEVFDIGRASVTERRSFRDFEAPAQFHDRFNDPAGSDPVIPGERVTAFNRYTLTLANYIWDQQLDQAATLNAINNSFDQNNTPTIDRKIATGPIDAQSIVLKPVFQFISGSAPTVIPYWAGISPQASTNLANPEAHTWRQGVVVDPTGNLPVGSTVDLPINSEPPAPRTVVSLDNFYTIVLTQNDVDKFSQFAEESGDDIGLGNQTDPNSVAALIKPGNIAVLVGMHVTTKEIDNWTWQTFWWAHNPQDPFYGADRPAGLREPWAHYNMHTAYFMVTPPDAPDGDPFTAFNPYLETNLSGSIPISSTMAISWTGVNSNCMSCHRLAAWKPNPNPTPGNLGLSPDYQPAGQINPADPVFDGYTKLDFLWSLTRAR